MCSFLALKMPREEIDLDYINYFNQFRGPDSTNVYEDKGWLFAHNLLSITGEFTTQPFVEDGIVCFYNGEIYNYKDLDASYKSDGEAIIPSYKKHGKDFIKYLDGEFAIVLFDFTSNSLIIGTDAFSTKPVWVGFKGSNFGVASYESVLERAGLESRYKVPANSLYTYSLDTLELKSKEIYKDFDVCNQVKDSYDDCIAAFKNSVRKRSRDLREKIFIGLSSGYDSGALACELMNQDISFKSYSIKAQETVSIIKSRHMLLEQQGQDAEMIYLTRKDFNKSKNNIKQRAEEFKYRIKRGNTITPSEYMTEDKGSVGIGHICSLASDEGMKIYFSCQGADEVFSDYGYRGKKIYDHSTFGGQFPEDLQQVFPWNNFYEGTQASYLAKEENVAGAHGIEGRYPFLDFDLVQEFLWLRPELKNRYYKAPIHEYLSKNSFPFEVNRKIGFSCDRGLL